MKKLQIFEPAMCCNTGFSGVGVDTELIRISAVIKALAKNRSNWTGLIYPSNEEIAEYLELPIEALGEKPKILGVSIEN